MRVISALYNTPERDYDKMLENLRLSVLLNCYEFHCYQLDEDPMISFTNVGIYNAPCYFKPHIIKKALQDFKEDILWLDADCILRNRVDEMLDNCDVAVTLRRFDEMKIRDIYDGYLNAGVMAFRYNEPTIEFIDKWIGQLKNGRADQDAIVRLLLAYNDLFNIGEIFSVNGTKVKILDCDTYNFFYFEDKEAIGKAKIFHIKGHLREQYYSKVLNGMAR